MKVGYSTCHAYPIDETFIRWTAEQLADLDYFRFEICREDAGIDRWITYRALPKLNDHKPFLPENRDALRRALAPVKAAGREVALWSHELWAPKTILDLYPELRTPRGDLNLAHPLLTEFVRDRYQALFDAIPEVDAITLTLTEVPFSVMHRFDSVWTPRQCVHWLIRTIHDVCRERRRRLIVRPFSAIRADYVAVREALLDLPDDIEIMLKCDPFDWHAFLPLNPALATYPAERLTVEVDLAGEYFGRGALPVIFPDYLADRLRATRELGVQRLVGRLDRRGRSALDREGRLNVELFTALAADPELDVDAFLAERAAARFRTANPAGLVACLKDGFEMVKGLFYVDRNLLFHDLIGDLQLAQRNMLFETIRPNQSLAHCENEWAILAERTTPSAEAIAAEKQHALALAEDVRDRLRELAPNEPMLHEHGENAVLFARLYLAITLAVQAYLAEVDGGTEPTAAFDAIVAAARTIEDARGTDWFESLPVTATTLATELRQAFRLEQAARRAIPAGVLDAVLAGYPGEGHRLSKFTHGSSSVLQADRCFRRVERHAAYTLTGAPGERTLRLDLRGAGEVTVTCEGRTLAQHEWDHGDAWQESTITLDAPAAELGVRFDRRQQTKPHVGRILLL